MQILMRALAALALLPLTLGPAAADTLTVKVRAAIEAIVEGSGDLATPRATIPFAADITMLSGTTNGKSDLVWADTRTIAASGTENIDLAGSLTTPVGSAAVFVEVTAILVRANSANTNAVTITPASSNGFTGPFADASDLVSVLPGGAVLFVAPGAGWGVTASTGDLLTIANSSSGTGVTYDIIVVGRSA